MANTHKCCREEKDAIARILEKHADDRGALMPVMQEAQDAYGYLPESVLRRIAEGLDIPVEEVYSTATFYSQFALTPKGKHTISVCLGTACYVKGSGMVFDRISQRLGITNGQCTPDGLFSLDSCRCIGACGLAPVMLVDDDVYGRVTPGEVDDILAKYKS